ncbi:MAG: ribulokinase [Anaeromyxobacter sp.]
MKQEHFVVGLDFGTDTVRAVVVDAADGAVAGVAVRPYPRWARGLYCDPRENRFRHHPLDYLESMEAATKAALEAAGPVAAARVRAVSADTTGSTPVLADRAGRPLALTPGFEENPNAMFVLWKDHTAVAEAERVNHLARSWGGPDFTRYVGGIYSSEWFWAKAVHVMQEDPKVAAAAATILELCDFIPAALTGATDLAALRRSRCAAGHKAMWHAEFGGYPADAFLEKLHPRLPALKASLGRETWTADRPFGALSPEWAARLGLPAGTVVAVGAFDAHVGAVGGGITDRTLIKIIGTSSLDVLVGPKPAGPEQLIPGICGQVDGSVLPGFIGYEAGQSAFGDIFAWWKGVLAWPLEHVLPALPGADAARARAQAEAAAERLIPELEKAAQALPPGAASAVAVDWLNGRRTPDANQRLKGAIAGLGMGTDAPAIYRALVEAAALGSRAIIERFREHGVKIDRTVAMGGVAQKSALIMQTLADFTGLEIEVVRGEQTVALGAAMLAATAAGVHRDVGAAQQAMTPGIERTYTPDPARAEAAARAYRDYQRLGQFLEQFQAG